MRDIKVYKIGENLPLKEEDVAIVNKAPKDIKVFSINKEAEKEIIHIFENNKDIKEVQKNKEELANKYKKLGIIIDNSSENKDILNFSKTIQNFKDLINEQKTVIDSIPLYIKKDDMMSAFKKDGTENINKISNFFDIFIDFFVNPPSKEAMEITNYATLLNKTFTELESHSEKLKALSKKNSDALEGLHIDEQISKSKQSFDESINQIKNFSDTTETNLNTLSKKYDDFIVSLSEKQTNKLEAVSKKSSEVIKSYNDFLSKNVKSLKGGYWVLFIINLLLAIALGGLVVLNIIQKKELDNIVELSSKMDNIKVIQNNDELIFEFPKNIQIIDSNDAKKIILK